MTIPNNIRQITFPKFVEKTINSVYSEQNQSSILIFIFYNLTVLERIVKL